MALHFQQAQSINLLSLTEGVGSVFGKEALYRFGATIEDDVDVVVSCLPGISEQATASGFIDLNQLITQPI